MSLTERPFIWSKVQSDRMLSKWLKMVTEAPSSVWTMSRKI